MGILFVPTAEAASEIPAWIKNNAGWWADGQIDDASFLNGIEYLINNSILEIQSNQKSNENGFVQLEKLLYEVPPGSQIIKVNVFAKFSNLLDLQKQMHVFQTYMFQNYKNLQLFKSVTFSIFLIISY